MIKHWLKYTEIFFFLLFSISAVLPFLLVKYIPSLDGPQHLYNARLLAELWKGNEFIGQYFTFNPVLVGNMSSLYILAALMLIVPAWIAEKILLSLYIIGLALSFRYFIRSMQKQGSLVYLLIFPFGITSLFILGYYNFCLAFIPFFLALGYIRKYENRTGLKQLVVLMLLILLVYITHALVFIFFGFIISMHLIFDMGFTAFSRQAGRTRIALIRKYLFILVAAIPSLTLWGIYFFSIKSGDQYNHSLSYRPVKDILNNLYHLSNLVGFHHEMERGPNLMTFWSVVILILLSFIPFHRYFPKYLKSFNLQDPDRLRWAFTALSLLLLTFLFPDQMITGSMTARLIIVFFFATITWVSIQNIPKWIVLIVMSCILGAFAWHRSVHDFFYKQENLEIADIEKAWDYIQPNTVIFPFNCSDNWSHLHYHCYLGVDKPLVDIRNPQTDGKMPLVWNYTQMPAFLVGKLTQWDLGTEWAKANNHLEPRPADYVFIWKPHLINSVEGGTIFLEQALKYYTELYKPVNKRLLILSLDQ